MIKNVVLYKFDLIANLLLNFHLQTRLSECKISKNDIQYFLDALACGLAPFKTI